VLDGDSADGGANRGAGARREKKFTVDVRNAETPLMSLWALDLSDNPHKTKRLTEDASFSVGTFTIADDGKWMAFQGGSPTRYERNITAAGLYGDLYLLEVASGHVERLTKNSEVGEGRLTFSPDSRWLAFSAPDDFEKYSMTNGRVYLRAVGDRGKPFKKLGGAFDGDVTVGFWSKDGTMVGGVLVKPVGFQKDTRYPLLVAIHGGPASADVLGFNGGYNSQVYAGAGDVVLRPNYRGSTNYGHQHKNDIVGNYYVRGKGKKFSWRDVVATLEEGTGGKGAL
jgi:dipeptidyl aminopeptidase/acylaminoacyl peptidase